MPFDYGVPALLVLLGKSVKLLKVADMSSSNTNQEREKEI